MSDFIIIPERIVNGKVIKEHVRRVKSKKHKSTKINQFKIKSNASRKRK